MLSAEADIFKCTNANNAVYYNDKPCPVKYKEKKMKAVKDVVNGYVPKLERKSKEADTKNNTSLKINKKRYLGNRKQKGSGSKLTTVATNNSLKRGYNKSSVKVSNIFM